MLLTKRIDDFGRLPQVALVGDMGFREQCNYCVQHGFVTYSNPLNGIYEAGHVTRYYGRTDTVLIPIDAGYVSISDDYIIVMSTCKTLLALYYHKDFKEKYCEVHDSPDTDFIRATFDWYRICCGPIREESISLGGVYDLSLDRMKTGNEAS